MNDWIKALNPTAPIVTEGEALRAARASAVGVGIGVVVGLIGLFQMITKKEEVAAAAAAATAGSPEAAGMVGVAVQVALYTAVAVVVIQAILAVVQWMKPNIIIPILFVVLIIGGLLLPFITGGAAQAKPAVWQYALSYGIAAVQLFLHTAGIRGASKLDKIRYAAANEYND